MKTHHLKTWKNFFEDILYHGKDFEVRKDDRNFRVGDTLVLQEWDNEKEKYTGREVLRSVEYILQGGQFGIEKDYVVMSIS